MTITVADIIVVAVIVLILGGAIAYIIKAKKNGKKCIGCPESCSCNAKKGDKKCSCYSENAEHTES